MTDGVESAEAAARRFAGELERLRAGLLELGVRPDVGPVVPVGEWPVTTALRLLAEAGVGDERAVHGGRLQVAMDRRD